MLVVRIICNYYLKNKKNNYTYNKQKMDEVSKQEVRQYTMDTIKTIKKVNKLLDEIEDLVDNLPSNLRTFTPSPSRIKTGVSIRLAKELGLLATLKKIKSSVKKPLNDKKENLEKILTNYRLKQ